MASWPFPEPPDTQVLTSADVEDRRSAPVVFVSHAIDGGWQFHSREGAAKDPSLGRTTLLRRILARDRSLAAVADLPVGWWAQRARVNGPWERFDAAVRPPPATRPLVSLTRTCKDCGATYGAEADVCPHCGDRTEAAIRRAGGTPTMGFAPEQFFVDQGVLGGVALLAIAVVWGLLGLQQGLIYAWPLVLLVIGLFAIVNGIWGEKPRARRRRESDPTRRRR